MRARRVGRKATKSSTQYKLPIIFSSCYQHPLNCMASALHTIILRYENDGAAGTVPGGVPGGAPSITMHTCQQIPHPVPFWPMNVSE